MHAHSASAQDRPGKSLRFICADCDKTHTVHLDSIEGQLAGLGIKKGFRQLVIDFGLLALGLPVQQVKNLTGRKGDTILRRGRRCREEPDLWDEICFSLTANYQFSDDDLYRLEKICDGERDGDSPFRSAFGKRMDSFVPDAHLRKEREVLRARIDYLVGGRVAYASTGEFWRADVDVEQNPWISQIRAADENKIDPSDLGGLFYAIAMQVRIPNTKAQALALQRPTAPAMTLSCLCEGMVVQGRNGEVPVHLPEFMDGLKEIIRVLSEP